MLVAPSAAVGAVPGATFPCCLTLGPGPLSFFLLRRMKKIPNATAAMTANPPIEPPTIGPIGVGLELGVATGIEELGAGEDLGDVEELGDVELGMGVGDEDDETACETITIVINTKEADDFPPSVAVAYMVSTDGTEPQYQRVADRFSSPIRTSWLQKGRRVLLYFH